MTFVLDGTISSATSKTDEMVKAHLKDPLVLEGHELAPAGTTMEIRVLDAAPASNPDIYGFVDVFFEPIVLADGRTLPLRAPFSHLNVNVSAGHQATVGVENTVGDIFEPTLLLHAFRKGRNFTLDPGAQIRALTEATLQVLPNGTVAISTPAPIVLEAQTPQSTFRAVPLATPGAGRLPLQAPELTPSPFHTSNNPFSPSPLPS